MQLTIWRRSSRRLNAISNEGDELQVKAVELILGADGWVELCTYVLGTVYEPAVDYKRLVTRVYGPDGQVIAQPLEEAHKEVSDWIVWSNITSFLQSIET